MPTQEISRNDWTEFFHGFSSSHQGWLASIEVLGSDVGAQVEVRELLFEGITADLKDRGVDTIALMLGGKPDDHLTHTISAPVHVRLHQTDEGADEALQIESTSETTTLVRFRPPDLPGLETNTIIE
jgi:hypothetical protein